MTPRLQAHLERNDFTVDASLVLLAAYGEGGATACVNGFLQRLGLRAFNRAAWLFRKVAADGRRPGRRPLENKP